MRVEGVCLQQRGLSDAPGVTTMAYGVGEGLGRHRGVEVPVTTLDTYYDEFGKDRLVVAIKLDAEGHGGRVVRGSPKMISAARNVFLGLHNRDEAAECANLKSAGFALLLLNRSSFPQGETPNDLCVATRNHDW